MRLVSAPDNTSSSPTDYNSAYNSAPKSEQLSSAEVGRLGQFCYFVGQWWNFYRNEALRSGVYDEKTVNEQTPLKPSFGQATMDFVSHKIIGLSAKNQSQPSLEQRERQLKVYESVLAGRANFGEGMEFYLDMANRELSRWGFFDHGNFILFDAHSDGRVSKQTIAKNKAERTLPTSEEVANLAQAAQQGLEVLKAGVYREVAEQYPMPLESSRAVSALNSSKLAGLATESTDNSSDRLPLAA